MVLKLWPPRYYKGLSKKQQTRRKREIQKFGALDWKNPKAYVGFQTDKGVKTRKSSYTQEWNSLFPDAKSIKERADATGIPKNILQASYDRGMAAWRTGHRPGQTTQSWSFPRVSSFLLCGKTHYTADADVVSNASRHSKKARKWFKRCPVTLKVHTV